MLTVYILHEHDTCFSMNADITLLATGSSDYNFPPNLLFKNVLYFYLDTTKEE